MVAAGKCAWTLQRLHNKVLVHFVQFLLLNAIRPILMCIFCVSIALPVIVNLEVVLHIAKPRVRNDLLNFGSRSMKCHKAFQEPDKSKERAVRWFCVV